jgi:xanthine dehydrogenase accessory factor
VSDWLAGWDGHGADTAAVLVTVAAVQGSVPRAPGAKMLVFAASQAGTVGGGHLEMRALEIARAMLAGGGYVGSLERFALGPSLGQCCGGAVHLAFELVDKRVRAQLSLLQQRLGQDSWRCFAVDGPPSAWLFDGDGGLIDSTIDAKVDATLDASASNSAQQSAPPAFLPQLPTRIVQDGGGRRWLVDPCLAPRSHLMLFGAGHVGTALIHALAAIDCHVTWVDQRMDQFPATAPSNVTIEVTDAPDMLVAQAAPGTSFLVMTHSHALDLLLCEAILRRLDAPWCGLIGSLTKRSQFEHRLQERGLAPQRIAAMVCPIGLPGITGKEPAVIAASVCCQLLLQWQ